MHCKRPLLSILMGSIGLLGNASGQEAVWSGSVKAEGTEIGIRLHMDGDAVRFTVPSFGWHDLPARMNRRGNGTEIVLDVYGDQARLELAQDEEELRGKWSGWGARGTVRLQLSDDPRLRSGSEPFEFENEGYPLHGTLLIPPGEGPFPAIVWTHGSGRITRDDPIYRSLAAWVVEHGIASLVYDKRPPEPGATMMVLGADAAEAVARLREHPLILDESVGVGGMSQGGWVSPIAASLSDKVGFVVGLSAPGVSPGEQNLFNQRNKVLNAGFVEEDAEEASRLLREIYGYLRTGENRERVWGELEDSRDHPWFSSAYELGIWHRQGLPPAPWEHRAALDFDPGPIWRRVQVPVICLWGSLDDVVPPDRSRERIAGWLDEIDNSVRELRFLTGAGHDLRLAPAAPWSMGRVSAGANVLPRMVKALAKERTAPPETRSGDEVQEFHGVEVPDPHAWLEVDSGEVTRWARAQDDRTARGFADDPMVAHLAERMLELEHFTRAPVPRVAGGLRFAAGTYPAKNYTDIRVAPVAGRGDGGAPSWRILVDPNDHPASPDAVMYPDVPLPSPDGRFVLYGASSSSVSSGMRLLEVDTGADLADETVPIRYWPWLVSWMADSSAYLYVEGSSVRMHPIGSNPAEDPVIFRSSEVPAPHVGVRASSDGAHIFVTTFPKDDDSSRVFVHELGVDTESGQGEWRELAAERPGAYQYVGQQDTRVFLYTTVDAPNGRVVAVDLDQADTRLPIEVVPSYPEAVYDNNHPMRATVGMYGDRIVSMYGREGRMLLRVHDLDGRLMHEVEHEGLGFTESALIGQPDEAVVRYDYQSMFDPGSAFELNLNSGKRTRIGTASVPFDPDAFVLYRVSYPSHDGTPIPMFMAHRKDLIRDGTNPVWISNWAAGGAVVRPLYQASQLAWVELGGIVAVPAVRGSGEYGEEWHRAGSGVHKATALDDFGAAAEWLASSGFSRADRIAIVGASASGPATAGAFIRHRDSFGAGLFQIPRIDLFRKRAWVEEYGDVSIESEFRAMLDWVPLANAVPGWYPPTLVQVGSVDTVAPPFHGYKMVAAFQEAQRGVDPALLQVVWGAGHSMGTGVPKRCETLAMQVAFLARSLGLEPR